jgi:hypothetical protein
MLDILIPRFEGIDIEPYKKPSGGFEQNNLNITDEDRERYKDMFYKLNPTNGILEGIFFSFFFFLKNMQIYNYFVFYGLTLL